MTRGLGVIGTAFCMLLLVAGAQAASSHSLKSVASRGALDCNGFSAVQQPIKIGLCTDFIGYDGQRGSDNGHYVGHDEPALMFNSNVPGSGNNVRWRLRLPTEHSLPATQTFENQIAFWFSMALCDPGSYPQNPCTPNSDSNLSGQFDPKSAGSAFLEMQFYPPGFSPFITQISCDTTHWCASLHINSLECTLGFAFCNPDCLETTNFGWIQRDGVPTGPAGPANATDATYTPNGQTLLMNQGDRLRVTIKDTPNGLMTKIVDLSTGQSGYMVASAANGFQSLDVNSCAPTLFSFHPEFSTAKVGNWVPWAALQANVGASVEIGHFTPGANGDNDDDDAPCFPGPTVAGCVDFATGGDSDFDGTSYLADWPDGTRSTATSVRIHAPTSGGGGGDDERNYASPYPKMQFETDVLASEPTCQPDGSGCTVPPAGAAFYPFWSIAAKPSGDQGDDEMAGKCVFLFGNDVAGLTTNDFGQDAQYGTPNLPWFFGTASSGITANPCLRR